MLEGEEKLFFHSLGSQDDMVGGSSLELCTSGRGLWEIWIEAKGL